MGELNEASLKEFLLETAWFSMKAPAFRSDVRATQRNRIVRANAKLLDSQLPAGLKWVKKYTSSANYPTESLKVTNPLVDGEPQTGTWALVGARIEWVEELARARIAKLCLVEELARITTLTTGSESGKSLTRATELAALGFEQRSVLATPDSGVASTWARDGVDRVTVTYGVDPASRGFIEVDTAAGILAADLVSAYGMSGAVVARRACEPEDDGATLKVVLGWAMASSKVFPTNGELVSVINGAGTGVREEREVRGLTVPEGVTAFGAAASTAVAYRVVTGRTLVLSEARAAARQTTEGAYDGTGDEHALIIKWKARGTSGKGLARVWIRRTAAAKATLTGASGKAISDYSYTWPGDGAPTTFTHVEAIVDDNGDSTYTVTQILVENLEAGGAIWPIGAYDMSWPERELHTRDRDDQIKTITYTRYACMRATEQDAWEVIEDFYTKTPPPNANTKIVRGSAQVMQRGAYQFLATWLTLDTTATTGGVAAWSALPTAPP